MPSSGQRFSDRLELGVVFDRFSSGLFNWSGFFRLVGSPFVFLDLGRFLLFLPFHLLRGIRFALQSYFPRSQHKDVKACASIHNPIHHGCQS